ncbi:MAG: thymidine kinase [Bacillota bacterium]
MGHLEIVCGSMFSGKSEELIRRVRRVMIARKTVMVFKPAIDTRYGEVVASHNGASVEATIVDENRPELVEELANGADVNVVAIDEAQFFAPGLIAVIERLVQRGKRVLVAGLDMDFARRPFGIMPHLMAVADEVTKLKAICVVCGEPACFNQRLINGRPAKRTDPVVVIGGKESYEARCRRCHQLD